MIYFCLNNQTEDFQNPSQFLLLLSMTKDNLAISLLYKTQTYQKTLRGLKVDKT
jgi:hypothetical protein